MRQAALPVLLFPFVFFVGAFCCRCSRLLLMEGEACVKVSTHLQGSQGLSMFFFLLSALVCGTDLVRRRKLMNCVHWIPTRGHSCQESSHHQIKVLFFPAPVHVAPTLSRVMDCLSCIL